MIHIRLLDLNKNERFAAAGDRIDDCYCGEYLPGDTFRVSAEEGAFLFLSLEQTLGEALVFLPGGDFSFEIPFDYARSACYAPDAFAGDRHPLRAREATDEEIAAYRNVAHNPYDRHGAAKLYPHAEANFVTREDPCFYERNAIDGVCHNEGHGSYPYHSWAGGAREDLVYRLDFGREIECDKIVFYLRADFPHDTYWKEIDVLFSDGSVETGHFEMTAEGQALTFDARVTDFIQLQNFKQISYPLSWAALSQIEVWGHYIKEEHSQMEVRQAANAKDVKNYDTKRLREEFHIKNLFTKDNIRMVYSHIDRIITAGLMPVYQTLKLEAGKELAADYFLQRREMGSINIGGKGIITVDGVEYEMNPRDGIYIGRGNKEITFRSCDPENPAKFYVSSCPAHTSYPIRKIDITKAKKVPCGSVEECNKRVINQYIHPEVMQSCQLAMGLTQLEPGSNWNTMPSHTHERRMEIYTYFEVPENQVVFHMMGEPTETRHIVMNNFDAVISPSWSIHSGVGTSNYTFIWAMGGENQEFDDMDTIASPNLK